MPDVHSLIDQVAADQNGPVAFKGILFRTHQADAIQLTSFSHTLKPSLESVGTRQTVVLDLAVAIAALVIRTSTKLLAQEDVGDVLPAKRVAERLAIELWVQATIRLGSYVADSRDRVLLQQVKQLCQCLGRVTDCINCLSHVWPLLAQELSPW